MVYRCKTDRSSWAETLIFLLKGMHMDANILGLEQRIETLINECRRLSSENRVLKSEQSALMEEKTNLKEKNRIACSRLERIVEKLRTLEDQ